MTQSKLIHFISEFNQGRLTFSSRICFLVDGWCEKHFENQCFINEEDNFTKTGKKRKGKSLLSWSFPTLFLDSKKQKLNDFYDRTESFDTIHKEEVEIERMKEENSIL